MIAVGYWSFLLVMMFLVLMLLLLLLRNPVLLRLIGWFRLAVIRFIIAVIFAAIPIDVVIIPITSNAPIALVILALVIVIVLFYFKTDSSNAVSAVIIVVVIVITSRFRTTNQIAG